MIFILFSFYFLFYFIFYFLFFIWCFISFVYVLVVRLSYKHSGRRRCQSPSVHLKMGCQHLIKKGVTRIGGRCQVARRMIPTGIKPALKTIPSFPCISCVGNAVEEMTCRQAHLYTHNT